MNLNNEQNFTIRPPKRTLIFMSIVAAGSVCGAVATALANKSGNGEAAAIPIYILCGALFIMSAFGIIANCREKIVYGNGIFAYYGLLSSSSVEINSIKWIYTRLGTRVGTSEFMLYDADYNLKMKFTDSFGVVLNKNFMAMLKTNGILPLTDADYLARVKNNGKQSD